ncbi:MAG: alcohol dehydrogenase, partial [Desulfovibrio sp.]
VRGKEVRTFPLAVELLAGDAFPTEGLLTHTFRLDQWKTAFKTLFNKTRHQSMKVAFDMRA